MLLLLIKSYQIAFFDMPCLRIRIPGTEIELPGQCAGDHSYYCSFGKAYINVNH